MYHSSPRCAAARTLPPDPGLVFKAHRLVYHSTLGWRIIRSHLLPGSQVLSGNVKRFRGGLAFKAHRLLYHSTLSWRVIKSRLIRGRQVGQATYRGARIWQGHRHLFLGSSSSSSLLLSSLELSDTQVYGPQIRVLLGTASYFCEVVVLKFGPRLAFFDAAVAPAKHIRQTSGLFPGQKGR